VKQGDAAAIGGAARVRDASLYFLWTSGVYLHREARALDDDLRAVCLRATALFEDEFGPGLRMWCEANWLSKVWVECVIPPDRQWKYRGWVEPRAHVFDGGTLILPNRFDMAYVHQVSPHELLDRLLSDGKALVDQAARKRRWGAVPWDGAPPVGGIVTTRQPLSPTTRARSLEQLWSTLNAAGAEPTTDVLDVVERAASLLHQAGPAATRRFLVGMHLALHELDRREIFEHGPVPGSPFGDGIPYSDDTFLYARCAIVLAGRDTYDRVLADPTAFARDWDLEAEALLELPADVLDELDAPDETPPGLPSYETGSNLPHWTQS
jgi:hypothetical protein